MIEYVVEESVRPDGAIRWLVTSMFSGPASESWLAFTEEEALVLAANRCSAAGTISVATRDGRNKDYGRNGAVQRIQDLRKMGVAADPSSLVGKTVSVGCEDCGQDLAQQNADMTKVARIKHHAFLCYDCYSARERATHNGVVEVRSTTASGSQVVEWETTDGMRFGVLSAARGHQHTLNPPGGYVPQPPVPNPALGGGYVPQPLNSARAGPRLAASPKATVMGVSFALVPGVGNEWFWWSDADQAWIVSQHTYDAMRAGSPNSVQRQVSELRKARTEGRQVVKAQVTNNPRRPAAPRPRRGDLHDLRDRTQALVVQIATMSDAGPIPDGQVVELSKSYAALQAEFDDAMGEVEQVKENLSIMRAIMFEHSDPRNAQEAIA